LVAPETALENPPGPFIGTGGFSFGLGKGHCLKLRLEPNPELYRQGHKGLNWGKPKTVGLRQDKSQDFLEFGLF
jgi:hypothetical protein